MFIFLLHEWSWYLFSESGEIRHDDVCLDWSGDDENVKLISCHGMGGNQKWTYNPKYENTQRRHL